MSRPFAKKIENYSIVKISSTLFEFGLKRPKNVEICNANFPNVSLESEKRRKKARNSPFLQREIRLPLIFATYISTTLFHRSLLLC